jgi:hypothetical protein
MAAAKSKKGSKPLTIATGVLVLIFAALPTAMLLAMGLAPTLVARIVDTTPGRYLTKCVAWMNIAGLVPYLTNLWFSGHDMATAIKIVTDVYSWFFVYSAAGMGWLLFLGLPGAVAMFRALNAKRRIYFLREKQKELILEWGECVLPAGEEAQQHKELASEADSDAEEDSVPTHPPTNVTTQA